MTDDSNRYWNYRVIRKTYNPSKKHQDLPNEEREYHEIHEVHYTNDKITSISHWPIVPHGHGVDGLEKDIEHMQQAFEKDVIKEEDIPWEIGSQHQREI